MEQHHVRRHDGEKDRHLRRNDAPQIALAEAKQARREPGIVDGAARDPFGQTAKERQRSERDDERRDLEPGNERRVQRAAHAPYEQGHGRRRADRQAEVAVRRAESHGGEPHRRADGQIDPAGDQNRRHRNRQQTHLDAEANHLEGIRHRQEVRRNDREHRHFRHQYAEQDCPQINHGRAPGATRPRSPGDGAYAGRQSSPRSAR